MGILIHVIEEITTFLQREAVLNLNKIERQTDRQMDRQSRERQTYRKNERKMRD